MPLFGKQAGAMRGCGAPTDRFRRWSIPHARPYSAPLGAPDIIEEQMSDPFGYLPGQEPAAPAVKRRVSLDALLKFSAALITIVPTILGWTGKHPVGSKVLVGLGIVVLAWIALPYATALGKEVSRKFGDRRFVRQESARLRDLLQQFRRFGGTEDSRALMSIIRSAASSNAEAIGRIVACDYIGSWIHCFQQQLTSPAKSVDVLVARCHEFTAIVSRFNRDYVLRSQKELGTGEPLNDYCIDQLEEFREEFAAYLRQVEQWAKSVSEQAQSRVTDPQRYWSIAPTPSFERVKSFRRTSTATS